MNKNINGINYKRKSDDVEIEEYGKNKKKVWTIVWIIILIFVYYQVYELVMYTIGKREQDKMWMYNSVSSVIGAVIKKGSKNKTEEYTLKFAGLGDIYFTTDTLSSSKKNGKYDFSNGTLNIENILKNYDVVTAVLNTPINKKVQKDNKKLSVSSELVDTLKKLNISAIATASYHIMDLGEDGLDSTIGSLGDISQTGISNGNSRTKPLVIKKNNISIGILSYTTNSNVKLKDSQEHLLNIFDENNVKEDISYLKSNNVDFIISYLYVLNDGAIITNSKQKECSDILFNNGVNVVLGVGSNTVQEIQEEQIVLNDKPHHIYAAYGLGNLFGGYDSNLQMESIISNIEFKKYVTKNKKGEILSEKVDMIVKNPIGIYTTYSKNKGKNIYDIDTEIKEYNSGKSDISAKEYNEFCNLKERLDKILE